MVPTLQTGGPVLNTHTKNIVIGDSKSLGLPNFRGKTEDEAKTFLSENGISFPKKRKWRPDSQRFNFAVGRT